MRKKRQPGKNSKGQVKVLTRLFIREEMFHYVVPQHRNTTPGAINVKDKGQRAFKHSRPTALNVKTTYD